MHITLHALAMIGLSANSALAMEQPVPLVTPLWTFDTNVAQPYLSPPSTETDVFGIHTTGVALDSHGKIYAGLWGNILPTANPKTQLFGSLIDQV
ncbi:MAG: hypothetical protein H7240_07065 [Glaciimonas sp.]|nr:hypothetical protein [Glaciimonas sp.]